MKCGDAIKANCKIHKKINYSKIEMNSTRNINDQHDREYLIRSGATSSRYQGTKCPETLP